MPTSVRRLLSETYDRYYEAGRSSQVRKMAMARERASIGDSSDRVSGLQQHLQIQDTLRPLFGKGNRVSPAIGHHPDFEHLKLSGEFQWAPITTMFLDIEGSTRLGLLYRPDEVFYIKNAVIQSTIDIIRCFDGHVHRIMGDAVLAFFGRVGQPPEQGAIDGLNCASVLRLLLPDLFQEKLRKMQDVEIGVRIGLDHGKSTDVVWGAYGYPGMEEVTATSFFVDVAAKLQQSARRNEVMIGSSLRDLLDVPGEVTEFQTVTRKEREPDYFISPNYTYADGKPVNYRKYVLNWREYLKGTRLAMQSYNELEIQEPCLVNISERADRDPNSPGLDYAQCGRMLSKGRELLYRVKLNVQPRLPFQIEFAVTNHGKEAERANGLSHSTPITVATNGKLEFDHWEQTAYRGLHYLDVKIKSPGQDRTTRAAIWIE